MAEDNNNQGGAQSKLGELFVDFGTKGLGSLVKGLNKIQAQFLLTKNAGEQFVKTLVNLPKRSNETQVAFDKIANISGLTVKQLRDIDTFAKENNLKNFTNDIIGLEQKLNQLIVLGKSGDMTGWSLLGLNPAEMDTTKPLDNMLKIYNALNKIQDKSKRFMVAQMFGFDADMLMALDKWNNGLKTKIELTEQDNEQLRRNAEASGHLAAAWTRAGEKISANMKWMDDIIEKLAQITEWAANASYRLNIVQNMQETKRTLTEGWKDPGRQAWAIKGAVEGYKKFGALGAIGGGMRNFWYYEKHRRDGFGQKSVKSNTPIAKQPQQSMPGVAEAANSMSDIEAIKSVSPIRLAPEQQPVSLGGTDRLQALPPNLQAEIIPPSGGSPTNITVNQTNHISATGGPNELEKAIQRGTYNAINAMNGRDN